MRLTVGLALLALLAGCGAETSAEPAASKSSKPASTSSDPAPKEEKPKAVDLVVSEVAFGRDTDLDYWWYAAVVENPNTEFIFPSASLSMEALGADGVILDSDSAYTTLLSGKTAITGRFSSVGSAAIASVEVRGPEAASASSSPADETGSFAFGPLEHVKDSYYSKVSGNVTSNFTEDQSLVSVIVIARNAEGLIVGGDNTYVDRLPGEGTARFEVSFFDPLPDGLTFEAYAYL